MTKTINSTNVLMMVDEMKPDFLLFLFKTFAIYLNSVAVSNLIRI